MGALASYDIALPWTPHILRQLYDNTFYLSNTSPSFNNDMTVKTLGKQGLCVVTMITKQTIAEPESRYDE